MSIVNRAQFAKSVTVSFPNVTATTFDVPRPVTTPAEPAYCEGSDHVIKPTSLEEDFAGEVVVRLPTTLELATVFLRSVEVRKLLPAAQKGLAGPSSTFPHPPGAVSPIFPSGAPTDSEHVRFLVEEAGNTIEMSQGAGHALLGSPDPTNLAAGGLTRSYPGITLRAGEYVRLTFYNNSGGDLNNQIITANYNMGQFHGDVGRP